jgi:hypothetical protein
MVIDPWRYALAAAAIALVTGIALYIAFSWRQAPRASRAMKWVAAASLSAGVMIGILAGRVVTQVAETGGGAFGFLRDNPCSPDGVPANDLGKAIVLTNQKIGGDILAGVCGPDSILKDNMHACESHFLARHALGYDLADGDTRKCIPYEEVAELCSNGNPPTDSSFCQQAFDFQRRRLKP